jgi:proteasome assembly chaperone (PAC2) family protein
LAIQYYEQPKLNRPILIACLPGLGNIGPIVADTLIKKIRAQELAEVDSWDFFYPRRASIKSGVLQSMEFPANKFYFKKLGRRDVIIFSGDEEPDSEEGIYISGKRASQLGNLVLDVAEKFGCQRVYTSCAAFSLTHHLFKSKVWGVVSHEYLKTEVKTFPNTFLMSQTESQHYTRIPGLKGLLIGLAKKRGLEAVCLRGELPDYVARFPLPYPRAARAVLEVLADLLELNTDFKEVDEMIEHMNQVAGKLLEDFPQDVRERIEQRKSAQGNRPETITQEDQNWINLHIDDLFKKGGGAGG